VSSIDRFDALFWCWLVHQPARRPWRLLGRSYSPQRCGASLAARLARVAELLPVKQPAWETALALRGVGASLGL
jgi:hypothetical protein